MLFLASRLRCASLTGVLLGLAEGISSSQSARTRELGSAYPILTRWIPQPRTLHPYPDARFDATHP
jgi:hypothetical protein